MWIGRHTTASTYNYNGEIAFLWIWNNTALSEANLKTIRNYLSGVEERKTNAATTFVNTGLCGCCWVDGAIDCLGSKWPNIGCEMPPGAAVGAGTPTTGGILMQPSNTNTIKGSRLQNANWTESGSSVVTNCTQTSTPFRDGRPTCLLTDNDGAAVEYIYQNVDITSLATGGKVQIIAYARDSDDTVLDLQLKEDTGGSCTESTTDFAAKTINSTWTQYEWTHTVLDGDCTNLVVRVSPTDFGTVASTTTAQVVMQLYKGWDWSPISYIETASAAVAAGSDELSYALSGGFLDGSGNIKDNTRITYAWTPTRSVIGSPYSYEPVWQLDNAGSEKTYIYGTPADGRQMWGTGASDLITLDVVTPYTPGTGVACEVRLNYTSDAYSARVGPVSGTSSTARTSPTGVNRLTLGFGSGSYMDAIMSGFKVRR
jgi:hypothetical protein